MQNSDNCLRCNYGKNMNLNECLRLCSACKKNKTRLPCVCCQKKSLGMTFLTGKVPLCLDCSIQPICFFCNPHLANKTNLTVLLDCDKCKGTPRKCCSSLHNGPHIKALISNYGSEDGVSYGIRCGDCYEEKKKLYS